MADDLKCPKCGNYKDTPMHEFGCKPDAFADGGEGSVGSIFNDLSAQFDQLCQERHAAGQKEYGEFTFLGNDVIRMMLEELADTANYCRYQFIKLMMLQDMLLGQIGDQPQPVKDFGIGGFKGTGDVGWEGK